MSLDENDTDYSILTFNGRQHKIENRCQLINILVWMFLSEISVISTLIVLVIIKFKYDITITNTCWPGLHTGTDCFPIEIDNTAIALPALVSLKVIYLLLIAMSGIILILLFVSKENNFPLAVVLALLTALIKLILPILMSIIGVIMNGVIYCSSHCKAFNKFIIIA